MTLSYGLSALILLAVYPFIKKQTAEQNVKLTKRLIVLGVAAAVLLLVANALTVAAAKILDPIIQFSVVAVGAMVLNLLMGAICFKEKITVKSAVSVIIAAFSVVMINYFN